LVERVVAWASRRPLSDSYCHCEFLFEDGLLFGLDVAGVHFFKASKDVLARYRFYQVVIPGPAYASLEEKCRAMANDDYVCSSLKAAISRLWLVGPWLASWFPRRYSYCSEVLVRLLHDVGALTDLPSEGVSPNDIGHYFEKADADRLEKELNV
jgi:hypothetical protein